MLVRADVVKLKKHMLSSGNLPKIEHPQIAFFSAVTVHLEISEKSHKVRFKVYKELQAGGVLAGLGHVWSSEFSCHRLIKNSVSLLAFFAYDARLEVLSSSRSTRIF